MGTKIKLIVGFGALAVYLLFTIGFFLRGFGAMDWPEPAQVKFWCGIGLASFIVAVAALISLWKD